MNKERLVEILKVQSYSKKEFRMLAKIVRILKTIPGVSMKLNQGNLYVTKGQAEVYPCIVSHIDTVHKIVEDLTILAVGNLMTGFNCVTMEQSGIGGDDKCGIFICIEAIEHFDNIKAVFFVEEEIGAVGSGRADVSFFNDCSMVLECDRKGNKDFVTNICGIELSGDEFQSAIAPILSDHGYGFSDGGLTDVMALKELGINIPMANMCCGYYRPHSHDEFINTDHLENCKEMVFQIFRKFGHVPFVHHAPVKRYPKMNSYPAQKRSSSYWKSLPPANCSADEWTKWWNAEGKYQYKDSLHVDIDEEEVCECPNCGDIINGDEAFQQDPYCSTCGMYRSELETLTNT